MQNLQHLSTLGMGMAVTSTTNRLATPTTTSNIFAAAGATSLKTVGGDNGMIMDPHPVKFDVLKHS